MEYINFEEYKFFWYMIILSGTVVGYFVAKYIYNKILNKNK